MEAEESPLRRETLDPSTVSSLLTLIHKQQHPSPRSHQLPSGWTQHVSRTSQRPYFAFAAAHLTTWSVPTEASVVNMQWAQLARGDPQGPARASVELQRVLQWAVRLCMDMAGSADVDAPFRMLQLQFAGTFSWARAAQSLHASHIVLADFVTNDASSSAAGAVHHVAFHHLRAMRSPQFDCVTSMLGCNLTWSSAAAATEFMNTLRRVLAPHGRAILIHLDDDAVHASLAAALTTASSVPSKLTQCRVVAQTPGRFMHMWWCTAPPPQLSFGAGVTIRLDGGQASARPPVQAFRCSMPSLTWVARRAGLTVRSTWRLRTFLTCAHAARLPSSKCRREHPHVWETLSRFDNALLDHLSLSVIAHSPPQLSSASHDPCTNKPHASQQAYRFGDHGYRQGLVA